MTRRTARWLLSTLAVMLLVPSASLDWLVNAEPGYAVSPFESLAVGLGSFSFCHSAFGSHGVVSECQRMSLSSEHQELASFGVALSVTIIALLATTMIFLLFGHRPQLHRSVRHVTIGVSGLAMALGLAFVFFAPREFGTYHRTILAPGFVIYLMGAFAVLIAAVGLAHRESTQPDGGAATSVPTGARPER